MTELELAQHCASIDAPGSKTLADAAIRLQDDFESAYDAWEEERSRAERLYQQWNAASESVRQLAMEKDRIYRSMRAVCDAVESQYFAKFES